MIFEKMVLVYKGEKHENNKKSEKKNNKSTAICHYNVS